MIPIIILLITSNIYTIMYYSKLLQRSRNTNQRLQARLEKQSSKKEVKFSSDDNLNHIINQALKDGKTHIKLNERSRIKYPSRLKSD